MKFLILSVVLFIPACPGFDIGLFGWVSFTPFFISLFNSERKVTVGLVYGLLIGSVIYGFVLTMQKGTLLFRLTCWLVLIIIQGFVFALYGLLASIIQGKGHGILRCNLMLSIAWVVVEFITMKVFSGFIVYPGLTQYNNPMVLFLSRYLGLHGASFLVILSNSYFALVYVGFKGEENSTALKQYLLSPIVLVSALLMGFLGSVYIRDPGTTQSMKISAIQANISPAEHALSSANPRSSEGIFDKYMNMTSKAVDEHNAELILWPETAVHRWILRLPSYRERLCGIAEEKGIYLVLGAPDLTEYDQEFNSVFVISPNGKVVDSYSKSRLVPLWEHNFTLGDKPRPLITSDFIAGVNICYEVLFPRVSAVHTANGANLLFVLSDNSVFGFTIAPYLSSAFSVFRAVENAMYVIQCMNTGPSLVVNPRGRIVGKSALFTEDVVSWDCPLVEERGLCYAQYGEQLCWLIIFLFICYIFVSPGAKRTMAPKQVCGKRYFTRIN